MAHVVDCENIFVDSQNVKSAMCASCFKRKQS